MLDFLIVFSSIFLGIIISLFINRYLIIKKENKFTLSNDVKSELNDLVFEKSIALEALNKINQFFGEKKIDVYEKDRLLIKYGKLLDHYDERIFKLQPILEVQEIYEFRKQLHSLISDSISKIDEKLNNFSTKINYSKDSDNSKTNLNSALIIKKISSIDESVLTNNDGESLLSFDKFQNSLNFQNKDENYLTFSSTVENSMDENNEIGEIDENNHQKDIADTKKDNLGDLNVEEINKIQKDILKILRRLETPSD